MLQDVVSVFYVIKHDLHTNSQQAVFGVSVSVCENIPKMVFSPIVTVTQSIIIWYIKQENNNHSIKLPLCP